MSVAVDWCQLLCGDDCGVVFVEVLACFLVGGVCGLSEC